MAMKMVAALTAFLSAANAFGQTPLLDEAKTALMRAAGFFRTEVSVQGSYLWTYSTDLKVRRGEGEATATQGWVQPPGTPSVGMAFLRAYEATGERFYLDASIETSYALTKTQLASGGWDYRIEFDPQESHRWFYRRDAEASERDPKGRLTISVYDDDNTQSALRFLMRVDVKLEGRDAEIRHAVEYGLAKLLEAQYPNGAWGQRYDGNPPDPHQHPVMPSRYPDEWSRTRPKGQVYWRFYTLNDGVIPDIIRTLLDAHRFYNEREYLEAGCRGGDFLVLAQMPQPQPAWAQQYNFQMEPAWARRFEPPAIASSESVGVIRVLMELYLHTGDERYLQPIPPAIEWFHRSRLPNGLWARFYELKTNLPLYFNRRYDLVYTSDDLPTHYSFQGKYGIPGIIAAFERLKRDGREKMLVEQGRTPTRDELERRAKGLEPSVRQIIASLDEQGRWVEDGFIHTHTFIRNVETLADYIATMQTLKTTR